MVKTDTVYNERVFLGEGLNAVHGLVEIVEWEGKDDVTHTSIEGEFSLSKYGDSISYMVDATTDEELNTQMATLHTLRRILDEVIDKVNDAYLKIGGLK